MTSAQAIICFVDLPRSSNGGLGGLARLPAPRLRGSDIGDLRSVVSLEGLRPRHRIAQQSAQRVLNRSLRYVTRVAARAGRAISASESSQPQRNANALTARSSRMGRVTGRARRRDWDPACLVSRPHAGPMRAAVLADLHRIDGVVQIVGIRKPCGGGPCPGALESALGLTRFAPLGAPSTTPSWGRGCDYRGERFARPALIGSRTCQTIARFP